MSSKRDYDEITVFGGSVLSEKRTLAFKICDFAQLEHKRGEKVKGIDSLPCHGHSWSLSLYPRGEVTSSEDIENVSVRLELNSKEDTRAQYTIRIGDRQKSSSNKGGAVFTVGKKSRWGWENFCGRDILLSELVEGHLLIEVDIQVPLVQTKHVKPRNKLSEDMLKLLRSGKGSDAIFRVGERRFEVHHNILAFRAPILAELAEDNKDEAEIVLDGVDADMFDALLRSVYGDEPPPTKLLQEKARDLLTMADRFGCENMKLLAESKLVETGIKTETAADLLLFADAKNCALLKEAALDYIKANTAGVMKTPDWEKVNDSRALLSEFVQAAFTKSSPAEDSDDLDRMTVATLRRELQKERLSEDGTRAMLVERLKASPAKKPRTDS